MLLDYPKLKKEIGEILMIEFKDAVDSELSVFRGIGKHLQHEGTRGSYSTTEGSIKEQNYQSIGVDYTIEYSRVPDMEFEQILELVRIKGKEMGEKMGRYFFATVNQSIEEVGNVVDANGTPFNLDLMFHTLEKMQIPFDEAGNPVMPTMVIHPDQAERLKAEIETEKVEKKYDERHKQLIQQKRKEWNEEQNSRKLVD